MTPGVALVVCVALIFSVRGVIALIDRRLARKAERRREEIIAAQMQQAASGPSDSGWMSPWETALTHSAFDIPVAIPPPPPKITPVPLGELVSDLKTGTKADLAAVLDGRGSRDSQSPAPPRGVVTGALPAGIGASLTSSMGARMTPVSRMTATEAITRQQNYSALMQALARTPTASSINWNNFYAQATAAIQNPDY